jgi:hypothetical protein
VAERQLRARPRGLGSGRRWLWDAVVAGWEPNPVEFALLEAAVREVDVINRIQAELRSASWKFASLIRRVSAVNR